MVGVPGCQATNFMKEHDNYSFLCTILAVFFVLNRGEEHPPCSSAYDDYMVMQSALQPPIKASFYYYRDFAHVT